MIDIFAAAVISAAPLNLPTATYPEERETIILTTEPPVLDNGDQLKILQLERRVEDLESDLKQYDRVLFMLIEKEALRELHEAAEKAKAAQP